VSARTTVGNDPRVVPNRIIAVIKTYNERGKSTNLSVNFFKKAFLKETKEPRRKKNQRRI